MEGCILWILMVQHKMFTLVHLHDESKQFPECRARSWMERHWDQNRAQAEFAEQRFQPHHDITLWWTYSYTHRSRRTPLENKFHYFSVLMRYSATGQHQPFVLFAHIGNWLHHTINYHSSDILQQRCSQTCLNLRSSKNSWKRNMFNHQYSV